MEGGPEGVAEGEAEGGEEAEGEAEGGAGDGAQLTSSSTPLKKYPTRRSKLKVVLTGRSSNMTHKNVSPLKVKKAIFSVSSTTLMGMNRQKKASELVKNAMEKHRKEKKTF